MSMRRSALLGSLWQRRRGGPGFRAPAWARPPPQPTPLHLLGLERVLPPQPPALPAAAAASQLGPAPGNAPGRLLLRADRGQGQLRGGDASETPTGRQAGQRGPGPARDG
jgi:hypothetical protein